MARQWSEGHSASILCIAAAEGPDGLIASGSEGGEVMLWSQEGAVVGHFTLPDKEDVTSTVFSPASSSTLYVSHGNTISLLDARNLKQIAEDFQGVVDEEINSLAMNNTGSALAVADDSGAVRVLDLPGGKVTRTLRRHTNICSSVVFRPQRPNNLVSAGLDMQVMLWSLQKTRPLWIVNLQDMAEEEGHQQKAGQLFNPPLAHCVTVANCGNVLACAAEDGHVHLMRVGSGSKLEQQGMLKAHTQGASQAHFLNFLSHPYWLATGGNDGKVALWDLSHHAVVAPEARTKPAVPAASRRKAKGRARAKHLPDGKATAPPKVHLQKREDEKMGMVDEGEREEEDVQAAEGSSAADSSSGTEEVLKSGPRLSFNHGDKVNWVCPALLKGEPCLLVADQSSLLTNYSLSGL